MDLLPRVVSSTNLSEIRRLHPIKAQVTLKISPPSTATLTLIREEAVSPGDWIRLYTPQGDAGVFYVKSVSTDYMGSQQTATLEHCYGLLDASLLFGKHEPPAISGRAGAKKETAQEAITYILARQNRVIWALDQCDATEEQGWSFNGDSLLDALGKVDKALRGYEWRFDMDALPFKISYVTQSSTIDAEVRKSRNAAKIDVKLDITNLCTRVYPVGKSDLNIASINNNKPYVEDETAVQTYGIISAIVSDNGISDKESLKRFGEAELARNCTPAMTITISGLELSQLTEEPLDRLTVGKKCRIPLPDYGVTFQDRITEVSWSDMVKDAFSVKVTLSTSRKTLQSVLWERQRSGGGSSRNRDTDLHDCELGTDAVKEEVTSIGNATKRISLLAHDITANGTVNIAGSGSAFKLGGATVYKRTITIDGVSYNVLSYGVVSDREVDGGAE